MSNLSLCQGVTHDYYVSRPAPALGSIIHGGSPQGSVSWVHMPSHPSPIENCPTSLCLGAGAPTSWTRESIMGLITFFQGPITNNCTLRLSIFMDIPWTIYPLFILISSVPFWQIKDSNHQLGIIWLLHRAWTIYGYRHKVIHFYFFLFQDSQT